MDILVVVLGYLLVVGHSPETSHVPQLIDRVKVVIKLLPIGILIEPLVLRDWIHVSTGMMVSEPYAKANGVSPVGVRAVVR